MTAAEEAAHEAARAEHWRAEAEGLEAMLKEVDDILLDPKGDAISKLLRISEAVGHEGAVLHEVRP